MGPPASHGACGLWGRVGGGLCPGIYMNMLGLVGIPQQLLCAAHFCDKPEVEEAAGVLIGDLSLPA